MNRREFLGATAVCAAVGLDDPSAVTLARSAGPRTAMGVVAYSFSAKAKSAIEFLDYCHSLGAGGVQVGLESLSPEYAEHVRRRASELGMYVEVLGELPSKEGPGQFERLVVAAKLAGALGLRAACMSGRRYEDFSNLEEWKRFVQFSRERIRLAMPVLEKHKMPLGLENHKDWTADELVGLMQEYSSDYLGVCLDTGNNIALLDNPTEVVEALAPYAVATHVKDMSVAEYSEGFRLAEVPLGQGTLDLRGIVAKIRRGRPHTKFSLEMITRDPLKIPCITEKYWATFPDRSGAYLARTLAWVRAHTPLQPLPDVSNLPAESRLRLEEDNVRKSLLYAREQLALEANPT